MRKIKNIPVKSIGTSIATLKGKRKKKKMVIDGVLKLYTFDAHNAHVCGVESFIQNLKK